MKRIYNYLKNNFYLSLITLYIFLYFPIICLRFQDLRNEIKYFIITKEFLNHGNIFILRYFSNLYPDKPPLYFWILSIAYKFSPDIFPVIATILGSTVASFIVVILTYKLILKFFNNKTAFLGAFSLALLPLFLGLSIFLRMDMLMTMFITYSIYLFCGFYYTWIKVDTKNLSLFYLSLFLGLFTKGIAGLAIPLVVIFVFLFLERNLKFFKKLKITYGILFVISLISLWFIAIYFSHDGLDYIKLMLGQETIGRIVKSKTHIKPIYYYLEILPGIIFPYSFIILGVIYKKIKNIKKWSTWNELEKITFIWVIIPFLIFSLASGKLAVYLLPILPPAIILIVINTLNNEDKYINFFFKLSEFLLIIPLLYNLLRKKRYNNFFRLKIIIISLSIYISIFILGMNFYNNLYSIKPFIPLIQKENTIAFSFEDGKNLQYFTNYPIKNYSDISEIKNNSNLIITKRKYTSQLKEIGYQVIFENKVYSILKK